MIKSKRHELRALLTKTFDEACSTGITGSDGSSEKIEFYKLSEERLNKLVEMLNTTKDDLFTNNRKVLYTNEKINPECDVIVMHNKVSQITTVRIFKD